MIGTTIAHYRIDAKIGSGGMGEVYRATDTKLDRPVALKFLSDTLSRDPDSRSRLLREAQSASRLNHPNILTIHAIEHHEGRDFIVMEYVAGQTLTEVLKGGIAVERLIEIVTQILDGLGAAHAAGIIHRDVKPDNIVITPQGQVRITDFGLAKPIGQTGLTQAGITVGTAAYMPPEQARGEPLDARSDLFSLGCILYEGLTGRPPFQGAHLPAILYDIITTDPPPPSTIRPNLPAAWDQVLARALAKNKEDRHPSASAMRSALRELADPTKSSVSGVTARPPSSPTMPMHSGTDLASTEPPPLPIIAVRPRRMTAGIAALIVAVIAIAVVGYMTFSKYVNFVSTPAEAHRTMLAVLPFENLGPADQEYFADGITDEITSRLAAIQSLGVISRTSAIKYKKTDKNLRVIASELGADLILEGTIRWDKSGSTQTVRITPQLIRVKDDSHLWAESYERPIEHVFAVQAEIAEKVAAALNLALEERERRTLTARPTQSVEAYDYYLRGNDYFKRGLAATTLPLAIQLYEKAVAADSIFAMAQARLSQACTETYWHVDRRAEILAESHRACETALTLDPDLPEAHLAQGSIYYHALDYDRALTEFTIVQQREPNNSDIWTEIGFVRRRQGRMQEAVADLKKALELDPQSTERVGQIAQTYLWLRDYAQAEDYLNRTISLAPDFGPAYARKAMLYLLRDGDAKKALDLMSESARLVDPKGEFNATWSILYVLAGRYPDALDRLQEDFLAIPGNRLYRRAYVYNLLNEQRAAQACYDSARVLLEEKLTSDPDAIDTHRGLALTYAGLERKDEAVREAKRTAELSPVSKDAFNGAFVVYDLAGIYTMVGRYDDAIDQLELLLRIPAPFSAHFFRLDPAFVPLRSNPRFQQLIQAAPPS
ncbi:MAG: protein kinase [candidate division Zixibacteria bacterium]|nr:protein kinase [candidate division Zixibacteria bacterium]